jgi:hypothetical protein
MYYNRKYPIIYLACFTAYITILAAIKLILDDPTLISTQPVIRITRFSRLSIYTYRTIPCPWALREGQRENPGLSPFPNVWKQNWQKGKNCKYSKRYFKCGAISVSVQRYGRTWVCKQIVLLYSFHARNQPTSVYNCN